MPANIQRLITMDLVKAALRSNQNYGAAIYKRHGVQITRHDQEIIEGWAGGLDGTVKEGAGQRRRVTFTCNKGKLQWHCTGNPKNHQIFCKHCVALTLYILRAKG